ncbi:cysteine hydrolase family protein [Paenibacillus sp. R14(2021)]|uniref:cysteine hydrolase family protein n=1 Tax=Paenibacillus sp. R14(2021) TaxID=2859228 RepID=UPI001C6162D9|nr:cysteine hydrolase [Paenibacillus sp. R14(2021)]
MRGQKEDVTDSALVILDVQKDFVGNEARMPIAKNQVSPMIDSINAIIKKANIAEIPIIYVGNEFEKKQFFSNWFRNRAALKGSVGAELDERLQIVNNIYFPKKQGDALSNSQLVNYLKNKSIKHLIIVGLFSEGCVTATAKGALRKKFKVTVIRDAVASATDKKREASIRKLTTNGILVLNSSELLQ